jgi:RNA polymerase sigma-70 factor, ECF subfamily
LTHVEEVFRAEYGRVVAGLVRRFGDIDLAEDALADALVTALERWPRDGVPPNPAAWLTRVAGNKAIDRLRREKVRDTKHAEVAMLNDDTPAEPMGPVTDDRLRLVFTCCHPALAPENRIALTLRLLGGLTVAEIAHAFLVPETTMAQRITRAKAKIKQARIPYRVPQGSDLPSRMSTVLAVLYLIFNEGYLPDQDRSSWNSAQIEEGHALVRQCLELNRPGPYQIQAAINAVHTDAPDASSTDWSQVVALYDQLAALTPSPIVALNRAVAVAELDGPQVALAIVDDLDLGSYHAFHATRADLLRRLGRYPEARTAYEQAIALTENEAERAWLAARRASCQ